MSPEALIATWENIQRCYRSEVDINTVGALQVFSCEALPEKLYHWRVTVEEDGSVKVVAEGSDTNPRRANRERERAHDQWCWKYPSKRFTSTLSA